MPQRRRERAGRRADRRHWLLVGRGRGEEVLSLGGKLPVFSFWQEAEAFLAARAPDGGWRVREFGAGELAGLLHDPWSGFEGVALDPLPEAGAADGLVTVSRQEFLSSRAILRSLSSAGDRKTSRRLEKERKPLDKSANGFGDEAPPFSALVFDSRGVPVVEVRGEIDLATVPELLRAIGVAGARLDGRPLLVVDLRKAGFIDVTGVRELAEQARAMKELGGEMRLVVPEEGPVARAFEVLGVDRIHDLYREPLVHPEEPAG